MQGKLFDSQVKFVPIILTGNGVAAQDNSIVAAVAATTPGAAGDNYVIAGGNTGNAGSGLNPTAGLITVVSLALFAAGGVSSVQFWNSASASASAITGSMLIASGGSLILPFNPAGWFQTATNKYLNLYATTTGVSGILGYIVI